jgi:hypothetical protein
MRYDTLAPYSERAQHHVAATIAMIDTNAPTVTHSDSTQARHASSTKNKTRARGWMRV